MKKKPKPVKISHLDFPATISVDVPDPDFDGFYTAYVRTANGRPVYERNPTIPHLHRVIFVNRVNLWVISDFDHFLTGESERYQVERRSTLLPTMKTWKVQQFGTYPYSYLGEEGGQFFHDKHIIFSSIGCRIHNQAWFLDDHFQIDKIASESWEMCEKLCADDGECKGWNYDFTDCTKFKATIEQLEESQYYQPNMVSGYKSLLCQKQGGISFSSVS